MRWRVEEKRETGSTNSDVIEAARAGAEEGLVITADAQTAGRGRMGRSWVSSPGAGLALSLLVRPKAPVATWGWLPLLTGVALADTVALTGVDCGLKWPNDLLIGGRKAAGILAEAAVPGAVVIGVGLNVSGAPPDLGATSLALEGAKELDRSVLLTGLLDRFAELYGGWQAHGAEAIREAYLRRCLTMGKRVKVVLPGDAELTGEATTVDGDGRLVIRRATGELCPIAAGDVTHVR
jgi:BirA family transcriptional regulator, biotin operon repressor / biotin---[acetyl-CoA-carboxylase] ligase